MSDFEITKLDDPEPWDRQLTETGEEFYAFTAYRSQGPKRTLAAVARDLTLSSGTVSKMAAEQRWNERAAAFDFYQDRIFQAEMAERQREMARQHANLVGEALGVLRAPIAALAHRMETDPEAMMEEFSTKDVVKMLKMVSDSAKLLPSLMNAERLATGQPTSISENTETRNINISDTERMGEILDVLSNTGVLDALTGQGGAGEVIDAEIVELDDGGPDSEADSVPPSPT